jgi:hypothetical protein
MTDLESRLRTTLAEHADRAPSGRPLAERILAEIETPGVVLRPRRGFRAWSMPLLAAAAVAAVVASVVGISQVRHTAAPVPPALSPVLSVPAPPVGTATSTPQPSRTAVRPTGAGVIGFRALDLTFVSENRGWALGSAQCLSGPGRCTAVFRTTDGADWTSMPGAAFNVSGVDGCAAPCVQHLRFANDSVGYAYGPAALFMSTDGGAHWKQQPGRGAEALETLDNNVIRVVSSGTGCPGPCDLRVETAPLGQGQWTGERLGPDRLDADSVSLARSGSDAYVLATRNPAGGAQHQTSTLAVSRDDGASWTTRGEPCPQAKTDPVTDEVDSVALAAAPKGTLTVLCRPRNADRPAFAVISHDTGGHFVRASGTVPAGSLLAGDPSTALLAAGDRLYRSTDGGSSWRPVARVSGALAFLGFESPTVGRAVSAAGRTVWTTHDGGRSWKPVRFR